MGERKVEELLEAVTGVEQKLSAAEFKRRVADTEHWLLNAPCHRLKTDTRRRRWRATREWTAVIAEKKRRREMDDADFSRPFKQIDRRVQTVNKISNALVWTRR